MSQEVSFACFKIDCSGFFFWSKPGVASLMPAAAGSESQVNVVLGPK